MLKCPQSSTGAKRRDEEHPKLLVTIHYSTYSTGPNAIVVYVPLCERHSLTEIIISNKYLYVLSLTRCHHIYSDNSFNHLTLSIYHSNIGSYAASRIKGHNIQEFKGDISYREREKKGIKIYLCHFMRKVR